jgi:transposase-like protein
MKGFIYYLLISESDRRGVSYRDLEEMMAERAKISTNIVFSGISAL